MNGCPHCVAMKPAWNKLKKKHPKGVKLVDYESRNAKKINEYGIQAFPTLILEGTGGKRKEFRDVRSYDNLYKFLENNIKEV